MENILPNCLITGASGFLGQELIKSASEKFKVFATSRKNAINSKAILSGKCDLTSYADLVSLLDQTKPKVVFHLAALSQPNDCAKDPSYSKALNCDAAVNLAGICADRGIQFIFTSTDLVFDGCNGPYKEEDSVNPISHYAEHKIMAEEGIKDKSEGSLICRLPLMFGKSTVLAMMNTLDEGKKLNLFEDEYRTPISNVNAAEALIAGVDLRGLYHFGGKQRLSRLDMGSRGALIFGKDQKNIRACKQKDVPMPAARPADVSLDSSKAESAGIKLMGYDEALLKLFEK